jgi:lipoate-protein ligase A
MNMAMDEAVMISLREGGCRPVLRVYKWNPPTITIGYFQPAADINFAKCECEGIGIVRRLTGGRAVLHDEELTYSILCTEEDFTPFKKRDIFLFIARCLVESLRELGISARITEKSKGSLNSPNCFAAPAQYEIESLEEGKLIGSAQVLKDGVVLQHGAIPLSDSYSKITQYLNCDDLSFKATSSLNQVVGLQVQEEELLQALKKGFGRYVFLEEDGLSEYEFTTAVRLSKEKYSQSEWMYRR